MKTTSRALRWSQAYRVPSVLHESPHQLLRLSMGEGVRTEQALHLDIGEARTSEPRGKLLASEFRRVERHCKEHFVNDPVQGLQPAIAGQDSPP